jgi:hypothetical protein
MINSAFNDKHTRGSEPDWYAINPSSENHVELYRNAMTWTRYEFDYSALKEQTAEYCKLNNIDWERMCHAPDWQFCTVGQIAAIMNFGGQVPEQSMTWFMDQLENKIAPASKKVAAQISEELINYDELDARQKNILLYVDLYSRIDLLRTKYNHDTEQLVVHLNRLMGRYNPKIGMIKTLYRHYKELFDDEIKHIQQPGYADSIESLMCVVNFIANRSGNASAVINSKKLDKKVMLRASKMTIKNFDSQLGLVGIDPGLVVGAKMALAFNSKTRKLSVYIAEENQTLDIKGQYIINFDQSRSFAKTIRKPKDTLTAVNMSSQKRVTVVFSEHTKGKNHELTGKMGKDVILIKAFKN